MYVKPLVGAKVVVVVRGGRRDGKCEGGEGSCAMMCGIDGALGEDAALGSGWDTGSMVVVEAVLFSVAVFWA